jgi:hypothetical protein
LIAKPKDSDSFYLALKKLLTDKKLYNLLKENVMQLRNSPEITWTARARKILKDMDFNL